jgi:signal transduction histidine kinase
MLTAGRYRPQNEELRIIRADTGEERIVVLKGRILFRGDGTPTRAIGTVADVTDQRRHEAELAEAKTAAEAANRAKSRFLANMSHELRTPLNAIIGFSDVMRQGTFGPVAPRRYVNYVEDIHRSGEHLLSLINDVLDMAKIESGKFELHRAPLSVARIAEQALMFMETQARNAGVALTAQIAPELSLVADARAIRQVLTNLVSNAVKFTPSGGAVRVFAETTADGRLALGVEDNGIGMTEAGIALALEPFGQVELTATVEGSGTGLGLPIVKSLIEAHDATFRIESAPGEGTRVWAEFPARDVGVRRGAA